MKAKGEETGRNSANFFALTLAFALFFEAIPQKGRKSPCHAACSFRPAIARK
jgi:hypothetical protein